MYKEKVRVSESGTLDMESGIAVEIMDSEEDSLSPKVSCLEKSMALEVNKSALRVENALDFIYCRTPCSKESNDSKDQDGMLFKLENGRCLGPVTPLPDREIMEISSSFDEIEDADMVLDCQTPAESIFDPFAPGPENNLVLAPKKKMLKGAQIPTRRQLNFDLCTDSAEKAGFAVIEGTEEEDILLESLCKSFLELIISNQVRAIAIENFSAETNPSEGFKTPKSIHSLLGIAEACPDAPLRPTLKSRRLDQGICRKLEFGSDLI